MSKSCTKRASKAFSRNHTAITMIPQEDSTSGSQNLSSTSNTMIASYSPAIMPISSSISSNQSLQQTNSVSIATTQADLQVESPSYTSAQMQVSISKFYHSYE